MVREPTLNYLNNLNSWNSSSIFLWSGIWSISVTVLCTWKRDVISAADCSVFIRSFGAFISCPVQIYVFPIFMSLFILHRENSFKFSASVTARSSFSRLCPARMWLAAHLFRTVTSSWSIDPFNIMKRPNFQWPVVWAFALCNVGAAQWDLLWLTFAMGQLFPCLSAMGQLFPCLCLSVFMFKLQMTLRTSPRFPLSSFTIFIFTLLTAPNLRTYSQRPTLGFYQPSYNLLPIWLSSLIVLVYASLRYLGLVKHFISSPFIPPKILLDNR